MNDWINFLNRKKVVNNSYKLIHQIINSIHGKKINIFKKNNFSKKELFFLYHWPLYIAVNTFYGRLFSILKYKKYKKKIFLKKFNYEYKYFSNTEFLASNYYNNEELNDELVLKISSSILDKKNILKKSVKINNKIKLKKDYVIFLKDVLKIKFRTFFSKFQSFFYKSKIIYEGDKFFSNIFPLGSRFQDYGYKNYLPNVELRKKIKLASELAIKKNLSIYNKFLSKREIEKLTEIFNEWIDHSISFSILEGLDERIDYYNKYNQYKNIKKIYSSTGYNYNDNFKIFSILAKRNKVKLIGYSDGITNFLDLFGKSMNSNPNHFKTILLFYFTDVFCMWGKGNLFNPWNTVKKKFKTKIINTGSPYLLNLKKWKKNQINKDKFTVLYPMGPLRTYPESLERPTYEENFNHFKNVSLFLKKLLAQHKGLKIIYKPFMGIENYPIEKILKKEIALNRVKKIKLNLTKIMQEVDIVLFDMLSTGFAETTNIEVPTLIYNSKYYVKMTSKFGKKINFKLSKSKIIFTNEKKGLENFKFLLNNLELFKKNSKQSINQFKESLAFPISKEKFREKLLKI